MQCPTCYKTMCGFGCSVCDRPLYWCYYCGTIQTCDGVRSVPYIWHLTAGEMAKAKEQERTLEE